MHGANGLVIPRQPAVAMGQVAGSPTSVATPSRGPPTMVDVPRSQSEQALAQHAQHMQQQHSVQQLQQQQPRPQSSGATGRRRMALSPSARKRDGGRWATQRGSVLSSGGFPPGTPSTRTPGSLGGRSVRGSRGGTPTSVRRSTRRRRKRPTYLLSMGRKGMPAAPGETMEEALAAVDFITRRAEQGPGGGLDIDDTPIYYNTDAGDKLTLSTRVARSPVKFSSCSSATPRFAEPAAVVDIIYDTDRLNKATVATAAARSARTVPTFRSR